VLDQAHIEYDYVNIYADPMAAQRLREINRGCESVPTLVFPDGGTLTEPSRRQLQAWLKELGYPVPLSW
jgi:arsenate reductase-like glutaredoxin family protein